VSAVSVKERDAWQKEKVLMVGKVGGVGDLKTWNNLFFSMYFHLVA
jgi:hypothetical protein